MPRREKLYGLRSEAVHGGSMKPDELRRATEDSWSLLREVVQALLQLDEELPDESRFNRAVVGEKFRRRQ